jgi:hypothetical protein
MHPFAISLVVLAAGLGLGAVARLVLPASWRLSWPASVLAGIAGGGLGLGLAGLLNDPSTVVLVLAALAGTIAVLAVSALVWHRFGHPATRAASPDGEPTAAELIAAGESDRVEFKSTARRNLRTKERDEKLELVIAKTVAGFLNGDGGTLLIGVADDGTVVGLEPDYALMKAPDDDRYELWLRDFLAACLGAPAAALVRVRFEAVGGERVCRVDVPASPNPVFLDPPKGPKVSEFWVRAGNSTRQLRTDEVLDYHRHRWP